MIPETEKQYLAGKVREFGTRFPGLSCRFAEIAGRRISHIAGDTNNVRFDELCLNVTPIILVFIDGNWPDMRPELDVWLRGVTDDIISMFQDTADKQ